MPSITCYGGVGQIGGNQLLIEDGDSRIFLDFGKPFHQWGLFYEEYLKPRTAFGLLDPLVMELLPPLEGIYRQDIQAPGLWERLREHPHYRDMRERPVSGVLLSHAHLDHAGYISFLREDTPLTSSALTAFVCKAVQDSGRTDFESEVAYLVPRELRGGVLQATPYQKNPAQQRRFHLFDRQEVSPEAEDFWLDNPGARGLKGRSLHEAGSVGGLEVRHFPVDHSIPGGAAYAVRTSAGWVAYTGDLRRHGARGEATGRFVQAMRDLRPAVLLCEGTRIDDLGSRPNYTEEDVAERALQELRRVTGLVIADFGPRNVERLQIFYKLAQELGRALVVLPRDAYLLRAAHLVDPTIPQVGDHPDLLVYAEPRGRPDKWEQGVRQEYQDRLVTPEQVRQRQADYILCFSFFDLDQLPTIQPQRGSLYLYSSHEAFSEELQLDFRRLRNWLDHFGMQHVGLPLEELDWGRRPDEEALHSSGHMPGHQLLDLVREVSPQMVVPIHVQRENYGVFERHLSGSGIEVRIPEYGEAIELG